MQLSAELEQKIKELREGITAAPTAIVANNREDLLLLFEAIDQLRSEKKPEPFKI